MAWLGWWWAVAWLAAGLGLVLSGAVLLVLALLRALRARR